jgi:hypothetical protein
MGEVNVLHTESSVDTLVPYNSKGSIAYWLHGIQRSDGLRDDGERDGAGKRLRVHEDVRQSCTRWWLRCDLREEGGGRGSESLPKDTSQFSPAGNRRDFAGVSINWSVVMVMVVAGKSVA